jgi:hypothetical protein
VHPVTSIEVRLGQESAIVLIERLPILQHQLRLMTCQGDFGSCHEDFGFLRGSRKQGRGIQKIWISSVNLDILVGGLETDEVSG